MTVQKIAFRTKNKEHDDNRMLSNYINKWQREQQQQQKIIYAKAKKAKN